MFKFSVHFIWTVGDNFRKGKHIVWNGSKGLSIFNEFSTAIQKIGSGGIFTKQLCDWLIEEKIAKDADRLVVISDSQDIDRSYGSKDLPNTSDYKHSYIIDISTHTHGIKTGNWTAEINGWSDSIFRYIKALEKN